MILNATLSVLGAVSISLGNVSWLSSGAIVVRNNAQWFSSSCATLNVKSCEVLHPDPVLESTSGTDSIGVFTEKSLGWSIREKQQQNILRTGVRSYASFPDIRVLTQSFPAGLTPENSHGESDEVVSAFPTFARNHLDLGVLFFEGVQCQNTRFFHWYVFLP